MTIFITANKLFVLGFVFVHPLSNSNSTFYPMDQLVLLITEDILKKK